MLFAPEAHKIDRIWIGGITCQDIGLHALDSYQEQDLNRLRDKCRTLLDKRKQYLYEQLKQLSDSQNDEDKERYESLCKQLADLGDEQAAVDAPADNSHLPGATLQWFPTPGMEEHVPIVFLNLADSDLAGNWSPPPQPLTDEDTDEQYFYDTEEFFDSDVYPAPKKQVKKRPQHTTKRSVLLVAGADNLLKHERRGDDTTYLDLKLVGWNDSSAVEVQEASENAYAEPLPASSDARSVLLRATARWDSSEHKSKYLNKETPLDTLVYLIVKVNVKFKLFSTHSNRQNM